VGVFALHPPPQVTPLLPPQERRRILQKHLGRSLARSTRINIQEESPLPHGNHPRRSVVGGEEALGLANKFNIFSKV